ncbi:hypothetical protein SAV14893_060750 [Streptomyces avermitilis]|uniref:Uncharacterized protein n=1 Tax=Streptomyces avermitilis TaxID=33903 RepID=A0A4D4M4B2_STRAX|nr:hypothetical protein SAV14893_060750 [Streptomyces avermitilis]
MDALNAGDSTDLCTIAGFPLGVGAIRGWARAGDARAEGRPVGCGGGRTVVGALGRWGAGLPGSVRRVGPWL